MNGQWLAPVIVSHIKTVGSEFVCVKSSGVYATASRVETGDVNYGDRSYPLVFYDRIYLTGIRIVAGCSGLMLIHRINYAEAQPDGSLRVFRNRIHESSLIPDENVTYPLLIEKNCDMIDVRRNSDYIDVKLVGDHISIDIKNGPALYNALIDEFKDKYTNAVNLHCQEEHNIFYCCDANLFSPYETEDDSESEGSFKLHRASTLPPGMESNPALTVF